MKKHNKIIKVTCKFKAGYLNNTGVLIFRAVAELRNSGKSAKFTKTRKIPQNSVEILSNTVHVCTAILKLVSATGDIYLP